MRTAWALAAAELNLVYTFGSTPYDDEITGAVDSFRIAIYNEFNFDSQKMGTMIRVFTEGALPGSQDLGRMELLAAYDESVRTYGIVPQGQLSDEARAWFLGHRYGFGTETIGGDIVYWQAYGMTKAADIILVAKALVLTVRQLAYGAREE
jgi:hypothetical protein